MKSKSVKKKSVEKSFSRTAGEIIGTIAHEVVEGKDKVVEVAKSAAEKFQSIKKAVTKKFSGKTAKKAAKKKPVASKKPVKKAAAKKPVKKVAKKAAKKPAKKKAATKK